MNLTNARIAKLWAAGVRDVTKISRKIGRPGPAGEDRVRAGLATLVERGEVVVPVLGPPAGQKPPEDGPPEVGRK